MFSVTNCLIVKKIRIDKVDKAVFPSPGNTVLADIYCTKMIFYYDGFPGREQLHCVSFERMLTFL